MIAVTAVTAVLVASGCGKKKQEDAAGSAGSAAAGSGSSAAAKPPVDRSAAIETWLKEFTPSTLSHDQQVAELK